MPRTGVFAESNPERPTFQMTIDSWQHEECQNCDTEIAALPVSTAESYSPLHPLSQLLNYSCIVYVIGSCMSLQPVFQAAFYSFPWDFDHTSRFFPHPGACQIMLESWFIRSWKSSSQHVKEGLPDGQPLMMIPLWRILCLLWEYHSTTKIYQDHQATALIRVSFPKGLGLKDLSAVLHSTPWQAPKCGKWSRLSHSAMPVLPCIYLVFTQ